MQVVTCGPNEAIVISGLFNRPPTFIVGGRAFIFPCFHKIQKLSLSIMTLVLRTELVYTNLGVPLSITGIAQVHNLKLKKIFCDKNLKIFSHVIFTLILKKFQ